MQKEVDIMIARRQAQTSNFRANTNVIDIRPNLTIPGLVADLLMCSGTKGSVIFIQLYDGAPSEAEIMEKLESAYPQAPLVDSFGAEIPFQHIKSNLRWGAPIVA